MMMVVDGNLLVISQVLVFDDRLAGADQDVRDPVLDNNERES